MADPWYQLDPRSGSSSLPHKMGIVYFSNGEMGKHLDVKPFLSPFPCSINSPLHASGLNWKLSLILVPEGVDFVLSGRYFSISVPLADTAVCLARDHPSLCFRSDPGACAVEMEYEAFRTSKMANSYKAAVLKKVGTNISICCSLQPGSSRANRAGFVWER